MSQNQENKTGIINFNQLLSTPSKDLASQIAEGIRMGEVDAAQAMVALKKFNKLYNLFFDSKSNKENRDAKEILEDEILKYKEGTAKTFHAFGAKITEASQTVILWEEVDDPYLQALLRLEKNIKSLLKVRQDELKLKKKQLDAKGNVANVLAEGVPSVTVTWDDLPELTLKEAYGEKELTSIPSIQRSSLRFSL